MSDRSIANPGLTPRQPGPEDPIPLGELSRYIPPCRSGSRRHRSAIYRYALKGVRGVKLACVRLPDGLYTTLASWDDFVRRLTEATVQQPSSPPARKSQQ